MDGPKGHPTPRPAGLLLIQSEGDACAGSDNLGRSGVTHRRRVPQESELPSGRNRAGVLGPATVPATKLGVARLQDELNSHRVEDHSHYRDSICTTADVMR